ncbi:hypothetical protein K458DRAFT_447862 [Lentithecium fluviatile CBS 122367]|uniref:Zn(2)-C6 fungal-type domain-containing protein n=1 Tax=Lentithecium fluviatile CBS 122367 TaxID=1168545 RepID=A0A6G1ICA6_9PLEO|nr:hypothetical protein K458DRAFT_447862 [Lentithecium fluviatile CBS 122367]
MRPRTGCLTCHGRKLKCNERKPICSRCSTSTRERVPCPDLVFCHQQNASMNGDSCTDACKSFYAYRNTFHGGVRLDIPKNVTFHITTNPYLDPLSPELRTLSVTLPDSPTPFKRRRVTSSPRSNTLDNASTPSSTGPEVRTYATNGASLRFTPDADPAPCYERPPMISPPTPSMTPPLNDPRVPSPFDPGQIPRSSSVAVSQPAPFHAGTETAVEREHDIAYLLRWFSEGPGHWMDLFDLSRYFSSYVPIKTRHNPLLRYATVACSAKALARVQGRKPLMGGSMTRQARIELYPGSHDWYHKATQYYDAALSLLLQALKADSTIVPEPDSESGPLHRDTSPIRKWRRASSNVNQQTDTDELLAASAIFCAYESLDASMAEWSKHLNGAKSLLVQMQTTPPTINSANLARQNMLAACKCALPTSIALTNLHNVVITKSRTHLDTEEHSLWKEAGLLIDENGYIVPSNTTETCYPEDDIIINEDLVCNALVWLMSKLVNFMAVGEDPVDLGPSHVDVLRCTLDHWNSLNLQFQRWYDGLPQIFQPCASIDSTRVPGRLLQGENEIGFPEIWYSNPMCASNMQCYYMSKIQLLMNKPDEPTPGHTTLASTCEIIGISLARPDEAVRIQSVQPLFTAGQCLSNARERQMVRDLLHDIEVEIGWATDYRVGQLVKQWQWEDETLGEELVGD